MPRASKVEMCMLCGEVPCSCGRPAAKKRESKPITHTGTTVEEVLEAAPSKAQVAIQRAASAKRQTNFDKRFLAPPRLATRRGGPVDAADADLARALRVLAPIMHESDLAENRGIITAQPTISERSASWRYRHGN